MQKKNVLKLCIGTKFILYRIVINCTGKKCKQQTYHIGCAEHFHMNREYARVKLRGL
jgi:hypothetical protein